MTSRARVASRGWCVGPSLAAALLGVLGCGNSESDPPLSPSQETSADDASSEDTTSAYEAAPTDESGADESSTPEDAPPESSVPDKPAVRFIGRFDKSDPLGPKFGWPGSSMLARFSGTAVTLRLKESGQNQYAISVDGKAPSLLKPAVGTNDHPIVSGLTKGEHTVLVHKRTESFIGTDQFLGFKFPGGGSLLAPPPVSRRIEFVGDSITCGYGDEGAVATCNFSADTENHYLAYSALTARDLGAEEITVAWSGKGMFRNYGGDTTETMPILYQRTIATQPSSTWAFPAWTPDAVIVDLATNDFNKGDPGTPFVTAYKAFVATVRKNYPKAHIFCAMGPMLSGAHLTQAQAYVKKVVSDANAAGDGSVHYLEFPTQGAFGFGCDYHPNLKTHRQMADLTIAALKKELGW